MILNHLCHMMNKDTMDGSYVIGWFYGNWRNLSGNSCISLTLLCLFLHFREVVKDSVIEEVDLFLEAIIEKSVDKTNDDACDYSATYADSPSCHLITSLKSSGSANGDIIWGGYCFVAESGCGSAGRIGVVCYARRGCSYALKNGWEDSSEEGRKQEMEEHTVGVNHSCLVQHSLEPSLGQWCKESNSKAYGSGSSWIVVDIRWWTVRNCTLIKITFTVMDANTISCTQNLR